MKKYRKRIILSTLIIAIVIMIVGIFTGDSSFSFNTISNSSELASTCSPSGAPKTMYVTGSNVNIRAGAGTDSAELGTLSKCTIVTTYCHTNGFYRISNSSGKYMSDSYLSENMPNDCVTTKTTSVAAPSYSVGSLQKNPGTFYQDSSYSGTITLTNVQNLAAGEENKITVGIYNSQNADVSSHFSISRTYNYNDSNYRGQMTITFTKTSEVPAGSYYVKIGSNKVNFTVAKKQLNFSITKNGPASVAENKDGEWQVILNQGIIPSNFNASNFDCIIKDASGTNRSSYFNITTSGNTFTIKNKKREFTYINGKWKDSETNYARQGTYNINIVVKNPTEYEDDKVPNRTKTTSITISEKVGTLEEDKNGQEVTRYELEIDRSQYNIAVKGIKLQGTSKIYLIENQSNKEIEEYYEAELKDTYPNLLLTDFQDFFNNLPPITESNKELILIDKDHLENGYHFAYKGENIFVYKILDSNITYVTAEGDEKISSEDEFKAEFPTVYNAIKDTKYDVDEEGYLRYVNSGNDKVTKKINKEPDIYPLAVTGGEYKIKLKFKDYFDEELAKFKVSFQNDDGVQYLSYANGSKSIQNADFDIDVDLTHMYESIIYVSIIYRSNDSEYAGNYNIEYGFGKTDHESPFTLQDGVFDYVIFSELSEEDSVDEKLECENFVCEKPMSNKKYPYYIGFYLKKSKVDVDTLDFALEQMNYKVYDEKATMTNGALDFYKEEEYIIKIKNYKNETVTFETSTDDGKSFGNSTTMNFNEFKNRYADAATLISKYNFDSTTGDIKSDNFDLHLTKIMEPTDENSLMTVTYDGKTVNVDDNFKRQHAELYKNIITRFVYPNGDYILGAVRGTRKIFSDTKGDIQGHDVSDQFFVKVNRASATDDTLDPAKAIVVLPKTEVDPGNYYVYVGYGGLDGVGYTYNYGTKEGEKDDDAPIDKVLFPEYWEQNIHETSIYYGEPEYDVEVENPVITNDVDETLVAYQNAVSHIEIPFVLDYIYDLQSFEYTIEYNDGNNWIEADDDFEFYADLHVPDEINENNYKESVKQESVIYLTTKVGTTKQGKYRIRFTYSDGTTQMDEVTKEFTISGNYFDLEFKNNKDAIFYTNLGKEISFELDCLSITNTNEVKFDLLLDNTIQPKNDKTFKDYNEQDKTIFTYTTSTKNGENGHSTLTINLKNYVNNQSPQARAGIYTLRATYTGPNNVEVISETQFSVIEPEKDINSGKITPKSNEEEMTIDIVLISEFINYNSLISDSTKYVIKQYSDSSRDYEDVSSPNITNRLFETEANWEAKNGEEKENYTGNLKITLLKDRLDDIYAIYKDHPESPYYIEITVDYKTYDLELPNIKELFDWDIDVDISGFIDDENGDPFPVDGIYRNVSDITINVDVTTPHEDNFKYLITQSCGQDSECTPNANDANYNERFTQKTYSNKKLELGLDETGKDDNTRLEIGDYQLVLYYNQNDYRIYDFTVNSDYVAIIFNDEISIATKLKNDRYVSELYTNKDAEIEIPVKVIGADYKDVNISITDPNQLEEYTTDFTINNEKFQKEHMLDITYKPIDDFAAGEYMIMVSKEVEENNIASDSQNIKFSDTFYNYELTDVEYDPSPAVPNLENGGKITIKVETEDLFAEDEVENRRLKKSIVDSLKITGNNGEDIKDAFNAKYEETSNNSEFQIVLDYNNQNNLIKPGDYEVEVTCVKNDTVISRSTSISFADYDRHLIIDEVETISKANDSLVHKNIEGTYRVKFTSTYDVETENIEVKVLNKQNEDKTDSFEKQKYTDHVDVIYKANKPLEVGKYTIELTYNNSASGNNTASTVEVTMYGDYKEIKIKDLQQSDTPIIAEKEGQYFTFTLDPENLTEDEIENMKVRVYDKYNNVFYSTIDSDDAKDGFTFEKDESGQNKYKLTLEPYGARVDKYQVALVLVGDYNYINESNRLDFSVDQTQYEITLLESSDVTPKERINNTDYFYDYIGANGIFNFTSTYTEDDDYSIKVLNKNKLITEIKKVPTNEELIKKFEFSADEISNGTVEFALCINGMPYVSIEKEVLEYIKITNLSIIVDNRDIDNEITLSPDDEKTFNVIVEPANATNQHPVFTVRDSKIATFNGNVITVTGDGETTIDVYTKEIKKEIKLIVYPYLKSDAYEIDNEHKTVFVNSLKSVNFLKSEFMNHLQNVSKQYKILNGDNTDVTDSTNVIGTNYKIVNGTYTYTIIVIGDVTGDGRIEMGDVTYLNRIVKGRAQPTNDAVNKAAHVLKNPNLDSGDVTKLNRFYRGRIDGI